MHLCFLIGMDTRPFSEIWFYSICFYSSIYEYDYEYNCMYVIEN